jgi:SAM-dependent methyltransferase
MISLADQYWQFRRFKEAAPRPRYLEIDQDWREALPRRVGASGRLMQATLAGARSVLDVGAGDRYHRQVLQNLGLTAIYKSADIAQGEEPHEYADFLSVTDRFDAILMLELIEHLPQDVGVRFMEHACELLPPGGVLWVSTPNAHHPNSVWRSEITHVRPWPAPDLYGALRLTGYSQVTVFRQYLRGLTWRRRAIAPLTKIMHRVMDLDYAQTIIAVAVK